MLLQKYVKAQHEINWLSRRILIIFNLSVHLHGFDLYLFLNLSFTEVTLKFMNHGI